MVFVIVDFLKSGDILLKGGDTMDEMHKALNSYRILKGLIKGNPGIMGWIMRDLGDLASITGIPEVEIVSILRLIETQLQAERVSSEAPTSSVEVK